ncbi:zwei Ig domain protein zig-4-like [Littorina saxatilis]|uniref:Ig-like domain-containing protein n=1 Tax=Littorina saxatilis TaxID=31220 RepID=A0AAN9BSQ9_9CAEN
MKMMNLSTFFCMLLLVCFPFLASAFNAPGRSRLHKRFMGRGRMSHARPTGERKLFFKARGFRAVTIARRHESIFLDCEAGGSPAPTIHWLKDGERIAQGSFETHEDDTVAYEDILSDPEAEKLRLSSTKSRLYLDCATLASEGEYTCVAETPYMRKTQSTIVKVEGHGFSSDMNCIAKRSERGESARVYMWTASRLEYEDNTVQLFCRASGVPEPTITWYDSFNNTLSDEDDQFSIAVNGDLIISDISWFNNMGVYRCVAENAYGSDSAETFLYPTPREDVFPLPF